MKRFLLVLTLTLLPALASAQISIDTPTENSTTSFDPWIGGWARDASGSGCGVDAVDVWLKPQPAGDWEYLGPATLGDYRADIAAIYGSACAYAGWHLDTAVPMHAGNAVLYAFARNNLSEAFNLYGTRDVVVDEADPFYPNPSWTHLDAFVESVGRIDATHIAVTGYGIRDGNVLSASQIGMEILVDDSSTYGYNDLPVSTYSHTTDCSTYTAAGWDCEPPVNANFGLYGQAVLNVGTGWHYARLMVFDTNPYDNLVASSNAFWFYVE